MSNERVSDDVKVTHKKTPKDNSPLLPTFDILIKNSNMTPTLSGHFSTFGLVFFVLKSLLGIARQWSGEKLAILNLIIRPRSHVRIFIYRTWAVA